MTYDDWKTTEPCEPSQEDEVCVDCGEYVEECACDVEIEPDEPDYNHTPYEESQSYREALMDAGRGHLIR
jgi:hypothetical protein